MNLPRHKMRMRSQNVSSFDHGSLLRHHHHYICLTLEAVNQSDVESNLSAL